MEKNCCCFHSRIPDRIDDGSPSMNRMIQDDDGGQVRSWKDDYFYHLLASEGGMRMKKMTMKKMGRRKKTKSIESGSCWDELSG